MNKKGFISISSVYAFFLVFLLLLLFTVNEMISNRIMINNIKNEVKDEVSGINKRPIIENVAAPGSLNSITVTVTASTIEGTITNYYYSIDNGVNYVNSTSNSYTFNGLNSGTNYSVKVYVKNSLGLLSDVSLINSSTISYNNPTVIGLSVSSKTNSSITLKVTASGGTNNVKTYYYSKNNGSSYVSSTSSSYTFSGLNSGTTYNFKVYVKDTAGYSSNTKSLSASTNSYINPTVTSVSTSNVSNNSITLNVVAIGGTNSVKTYYYSKDNGSSYVSSTSSNYTFSGLSTGTTYNFKVYVVDTAGYSSNTKSINASTESILYFADYIKNSYGKDSDLIISDNNYFYSGSNSNNYVCFGTSSSTCSDEFLYRIIGVYDSQVKLVKNSLLDKRYTYASSSNHPYWSDSPLQLYLNSTWINSLQSSWQNMISISEWPSLDGSIEEKIGILNKDEASIGKEWLKYPEGYDDIYDSEVDRYENVSDSYNDIEAEVNGTIHQEWLIDAYSPNYVYRFNEDGSIVSNKRAHCDHSTSFCRKRYARPAFYLNSDVTYVSGNGTKSNPYRIS